MALTNFAFLHGGGQGGWIWAETTAAVAAQSGGSARTLVLDVPGCGTKRGRDTSAIEFDDIAGELIADIAAAGMRKVVLVGHSQAGMAMPRMAEFRPDLFAGLVYVSCMAPPPGMSVYTLMGDCFHGEREDRIGWPVDRETTTAGELAHAMFCNDMTIVEADAFVAKLGVDVWPVDSYIYSDWRYDHLSDIPATYVGCLQDMSFPSLWQVRFAARLRAARTIHIDAGHQVMNTRPHALAEVLLAEAQR